MADILYLTVRIERKRSDLPRFVVVPPETVEPWSVEGTTDVELSLDGHHLGRRTLKRWGAGRDVWFIDLTEAQCRVAGVETGDEVRIEIGVADTSPPPELARLLASESEFRRRWDALSPSCRRAHREHVRDAKRATTRERRAASVRDEVMA